MKLKNFIIMAAIALLAVVTLTITTTKTADATGTDVVFDDSDTWKVKVTKAVLDEVEKIYFVNDKNDPLLAEYTLGATADGTFTSTSLEYYLVDGDADVEATKEVLVIYNNAGGKILAPTNSSSLFGNNGGRTQDIINLKEIYFNEVFVADQNTEKMIYMFYGVNTLEYIDTFVGWDVSNVTSMKGMFGNNSNLKSLDLSPFVTTSVEYMSEMFLNCSKLEYLNISNFDTTLCDDYSRIFEGLSTETTITLDLSSFVIRKNAAGLITDFFANTVSTINCIIAPKEIGANIGDITLPNGDAYFQIDNEGNKKDGDFHILNQIPSNVIVYNEVGQNKYIKVKELQKYADAIKASNPNFTEDQKAELDKIVEDYTKLINSAIDMDTTNAKFEEGKLALDKSEGTSLLQNHYNDLINNADPAYTGDDLTKLDEALNTAIANVNASTTAAEVDTAVANGILEMNRVQAVKDLNDYFTKLTSEQDYTSTQLAALTAARDEALANVAAANAETLADCVSNGKFEMDKVASKKEIEDYYDDLQAAHPDLTPEQKQELTDILNATYNNIDNANSADGLDTAVKAGKLDMDKVIAIKELEDYYNDIKNNNPDLNEDQLAALDQALEDGKKEINNATDNDGINKAVDDAKKDMDKALDLTVLSDFLNTWPLLLAIFVMAVLLFVVAVIGRKIKPNAVMNS